MYMTMIHTIDHAIIDEYSTVDKNAKASSFSNCSLGLCIINDVHERVVHIQPVLLELQVPFHFFS